jgi:hypothetical protein
MQLGIATIDSPGGAIRIKLSDNFANTLLDRNPVGEIFRENSMAIIEIFKQ